MKKRIPEIRQGVRAPLARHTMKPRAEIGFL
jgi:hypothetical protein